MTDAYAATASAYDLFSAGARVDQAAALDALVPLVRPTEGPVLDVGAGSCASTAHILDRRADVRVLALEPSPSMRALALMRVALRPDWFPRVTIRPESFFDAPLPESIGAAILLGVIGHFDAGERAAVLAELADRLPVGGAALLDLQAPQRPARIDAYEFIAARIGDLDYRCIAQAWPLGGERMRWRMTYLTLEGERVLVEDTTEHVYHHPHPDLVAAEAERAGLRFEPIADGGFWLLTKGRPRVG